MPRRDIQLLRHSISEFCQVREKTYPKHFMRRPQHRDTYWAMLNRSADFQRTKLRTNVRSSLLSHVTEGIPLSMVKNIRIEN